MMAFRGPSIRFSGLVVALSLVVGCNKPGESAKSNEAPNKPADVVKAPDAPTESTEPKTDPSQKTPPKKPSEMNEAERMREKITRRSAVPDSAVTIAPPKTNGWVANKSDALVVAEKIDSKLANIKNGIMQSRLFVKLGDRGSGISETFSAYKNKTRYKLHYPVVGNRAYQEITTNRVDVNGKTIKTVVDSKISATLPPFPQANLDNFGTNFPSIVMSGLGNANKPFAKIVNEAKAKKWVITTEKTEQLGMPSTRLVMVSPSKDRTYEVIVTDTLGFPTTIRTSIKGAKAPKQLAWYGYWAMKKTDLVDKDFGYTPETSPIAKLPMPTDPKQPKKPEAQL